MPKVSEKAEFLREMQELEGGAWCEYDDDGEPIEEWHTPEEINAIYAKRKVERERLREYNNRPLCCQCIAGDHLKFCTACGRENADYDEEFARGEFGGKLPVCDEREHLSLVRVFYMVAAQGEGRWNKRADVEEEVRKDPFCWHCGEKLPVEQVIEELAVW
jgi:hypothetical protein